MNVRQHRCLTFRHPFAQMAIWLLALSALLPFNGLPAHAQHPSCDEALKGIETGTFSRLETLPGVLVRGIKNENPEIEGTELEWQGFIQDTDKLVAAILERKALLEKISHHTIQVELESLEFSGEKGLLIRLGHEQESLFVPFRHKYILHVTRIRHESYARYKPFDSVVTLRSSFELLVSEVKEMTHNLKVIHAGLGKAPSHLVAAPSKTIRFYKGLCAEDDADLIKLAENGIYPRISNARDKIEKAIEKFLTMSLDQRMEYVWQQAYDRQSDMGTEFVGGSTNREIAYGWGCGVVFEMDIPEDSFLYSPLGKVNPWADEEESLVPFFIKPAWIIRVTNRNGHVIWERKAD